MAILNIFLGWCFPKPQQLREQNQNQTKIKYSKLLMVTEMLVLPPASEREKKKLVIMTLIWRGVCGVGRDCAGDLHSLSHLVIPVAYWERSRHPQVKDKETEVQQNLNDFQGGICEARKENLIPAPGSHASPTSLTPLLGCLHLSARTGHPCMCAQSL